jgi:hypothetical protein
LYDTRREKDFGKEMENIPKEKVQKCISYNT